MCLLSYHFFQFAKYVRILFVPPQSALKLKKVQYYIRVWVFARLPQRLKSMFFLKKFISPLAHLEPLRLKIFQKNVEFSL